MAADESNRRAQFAEDLLQAWAAELPLEALFTRDERDLLQRRLRAIEPTDIADDGPTLDPPELDE